VVEQGDNEQIPTLESLKKFIPADKLWPINDAWYMHAGAIGKTSTLANIQLVLQQRYGPSSGVEEFVRKAQLAHYEDTRAHFEAFAAAGWANHKVTMYWMLNSHWPSFYGNLIDYYLSPGGAYFGAKKGLRPLSVVFDSYATGDHSQARIIVFNQTPGDVGDLKVRTRVYDLDGKLRDERIVDGIEVPYNGAKQVGVLPRYPASTPVFFVRCQLFDRSGKLVGDNVYWQSQKDDDLGGRRNDNALEVRQDTWADMTALNTMSPATVEVSATRTQASGTNRVTVRVRNPSERIAFFVRATISATREGNEILPIEYDDNYITVFPGETGEIHAVLPTTAKPGWVKLEGYNTPGVSVPLR
jgi:exo-1,4-beta-D-glucosaminidase